jgi:hypothetical protein
LGAGLRRVQDQTVERGRLALLYFREQFIGFGEIACVDRLLSLGFEGRYLRIITGLGGSGGLQGLEPLRDLDQLYCKPLRWNVRLANDVQRRTNLALIEF